MVDNNKENRDPWFSRQEELKPLKLTFWENYKMTIIKIKPLKIIESQKW